MAVSSVSSPLAGRLAGRTAENDHRPEVWLFSSGLRQPAVREHRQPEPRFISAR